MWPAQRFVRQVLQALHEGRVALVKAWAHEGVLICSESEECQMGSEVNENILTRYVCQVGSTRLESVHTLSKHQTVESGQVPLHY